MKIILVSFFQSNNLGDLAITESIEDLILKNSSVELVRYNFLTFEKIANKRDLIDYLKFKRCDIYNLKPTIKDSFKTFLKGVLGERIIGLVAFRLRNLNKSKLNMFISDVQKADKLIIGGGNMIMDLTPSWPYIFNTYCNIAKKNNVPYQIAYVGVGPFKFDESKIAIKRAFLNAEKISVRGSKSKKELDSIICNKEIIKTIDPVFSLYINKFTKRIKKISELIKGRKDIYIGICIISRACFKNNYDYEAYVKDIVELLSREYNIEYSLNYELFSTEIMDYRTIKVIKDRVKDKKDGISIKVRKIHSVDELIKFYDTLDYLIGGRMHSLIFAHKCLLPYTGIIWQNKLVEFGEVTQSNNKLYKLDEIKNISINKIICTDIVDENRIHMMNSYNKALYLDVLKGL